MEKKTITLSMETADALLQYLATRPYGEVYQLIARMQADAAAEKTETEEEEK